MEQAGRRRGLAIAWIFPGQGSQSVGMGRALAGAAPEARSVWAETEHALDQALSTLAWDGPAEQLDQTENAQPAILAASVAIERTLRGRWLVAGSAPAAPAYLAG